MKMPNFNYFFIAAAALAQGIMWVNVFSLIHHGVLVYIGAIPAGMAVVGLLVYSANALPKVQSKRARLAGWIVLILVVICEPIVLGVVNWWAMPAELKILPVSYVVAGGASLVISLVLVMGALVDRSLIPAEKPARSGRQPATSRARLAPKLATASFVCQVAGCVAKPFGSQSALNAHQRKHTKVGKKVK